MAAWVVALKPKDLAVAKALLQDPAITVAEVARRLGVVPSRAKGCCEVCGRPHG